MTRKGCGRRRTRTTRSCRTRGSTPPSERREAQGCCGQNEAAACSHSTPAPAKLLVLTASRNSGSRKERKGGEGGWDGKRERRAGSRDEARVHLLLQRVQRRRLLLRIPLPRPCPHTHTTPHPSASTVLCTAEQSAAHQRGACSRDARTVRRRRVVSLWHPVSTSA